MREQAQSSESKREPWTLIPVFGVTQVVNTLAYLLFAVVPFYTMASGGPDASGYSVAASGPLGSLMLVGGQFAVTLGRLLGITLVALLAVLIPAGWRTLSRPERLMWLAALLMSLLVYSATWSQSYAIQKWILT